MKSATKAAKHATKQEGTPIAATRRVDRHEAYRLVEEERYLEDEQARDAELVEDVGEVAVEDTLDDEVALRRALQWTRLPDGTWLFGRIGTLRPVDGGRRWMARFGKRTLGPYASLDQAQRLFERLARALERGE